MGKRGPGKKPTQLKILQGNPGKKRLPESQPEFSPSGPEAPQHLEGVALDEWNRIYPELQRLGMMQTVDRAALANYCISYADSVELEKQCQSEGLWIENQFGTMITAPWANLKVKTLAQMRVYLREFGFTPSSRVDVVGTVKHKENDLEKWKREKAEGE